MIIHNIWKNLFQNLEHNYDADKNLEMLSSATLGSNSEPERLKNFPKDPNTIIISVATFTGNIKIIHSLTNLGETRECPKDKIMALYGQGTSFQPVIISKSSLLEILEVDFPTEATLKSFADE